MPDDIASTGRTLLSAAMVVINTAGVILVRLRPQPPWEVRRPNTPLDLGALWGLVEFRRHGDIATLPRLPAGRVDAATAHHLEETLDEFGFLTPGPDRHLNTDENLSRLEMPLQDFAPLAFGELLLNVPISLRVVAGEFEAVDHNGTPTTRLDPDEVWAALSFASPRTVSDAFEDQAARLGDNALTSDRFERLLARLGKSGYLKRHDPTGIQSMTAEEEQFRRSLSANNSFRRHARGDTHPPRRDRRRPMRDQGRQTHQGRSGPGGREHPAALDRNGVGVRACLRRRGAR